MSDSPPKFADNLIEECRRNPEETARAMVKLSERVCNNGLTSMNGMLATLRDMEDGEEAAELSGASEPVCGAYAKLMRDAFLVPIIVTTLLQDGKIALMTIPSQPEEIVNRAKLHDQIWEQAEELEPQIEGLLAFQQTTDMKSAYGQLILKLATTVLAEIHLRKAARQHQSGTKCQ
jgi:hypothetical protein